MTPDDPHAPMLAAADPATRERLLAELAPYAGPKGNFAFPHNGPLPLDLIGQVAEGLAQPYAAEPTPRPAPSALVRLT